MEKSFVAMLAAVVLTVMVLVPAEQGQAGLGISGQERIKTLDVYLDPENTGSVSYVVHLANGLAIEGASDSWEEMDQYLRLSEALVRPNTTAYAELKDDKIISILIRAGSAF